MTLTPQRPSRPWSLRTATLVLAVGGLSLLGTRASAGEPRRDQTKIGRQSAAEARARAAQRQASDERLEARARTQRDASRIPRMQSPTVQVRGEPEPASVVGWSASLDEPSFSDRRRRLPAQPVPPSYVHTLHPGERFLFDVFLAGNPTGLAEAGVTEYRPDPRGGPPKGSGTYTITGRAVTSGVISLLASMEDRIITTVDSSTGAVTRTVNILERSGIGASKLKRRVTETDFEGRGHIRIVDDRDGKTTQVVRDVPRNTFDAMSAMAWVRSLNLAPGELATAHVLDGRVLMRVDVVGRGLAKLDPMPSVAHGLGVKPGDVTLLEGTLARVDRWGVVREDKRKFSFRAYVTNDDRRLLLAIETDMWLGVLRLVLNRYDPPHTQEPAAPTP